MHNSNIPDQIAETGIDAVNPNIGGYDRAGNASSNMNTGIGQHVNNVPRYHTSNPMTSQDPYNGQR